MSTLWTARLRNSFNSKTLRKRLIKKTPSQKSKEIKRQFPAAPKSNCRCLNVLLRRLYWAGRRLQYYLCFYNDDFEIDVEDLLNNPFNTHPPSLVDLERATGFNRQWLMFVYRNFKQQCPNGRMTLAQWHEIFRSIFPTGADYSFADRVFKAMDPCQAGCITFEDLILCVFDLSNELNADGATAADFAFSMMDPDCQGRLDRRQFNTYTQSVFDLNGFSKDCGLFIERQFSPNEVSRQAARQFEALDEDQDGYITVLDMERIFKRSYIVKSEWFPCKREDAWMEERKRAPSIPLVTVGHGRRRVATIVKAEKRRAIYSVSSMQSKPPPVHV